MLALLLHQVFGLVLAKLRDLLRSAHLRVTSSSSVSSLLVEWPGSLSLCSPEYHVQLPKTRSVLVRSHLDASPIALGALLAERLLSLLGALEWLWLSPRLSRVAV